MVENFQARPRNVWLVAGPWQHGLPYGQPADIGFGPYLAWWDRWLGGRRDAPLPAAKVTSYEIPSPGAGTGWKRFSTWPPRGARQERLSLAADGTLSSSPSAATTRGFTVNTETTPASPDEKLTFQTRPRRGDLVLAGEVTAKVRAAFTATDGNIAVIVEDVAPDGTSNRITQGWLKAGHRFGHDRAVPVRPGTVYDLDIRTWPTHYRLSAGHSLRVTISSDDYPEIDSDAPAGQVSLRLGRGGTEIRLTTYEDNR
ncbi:CocE/NonD family hydrolase C-terminal non-catalytic domain-containing protein [Nonomuraea sp. AD125B]|uniref:CocE/NonD family hydrolase C-terminal non-catalytic domain-containing protein n=1 Tax=Nonomuraea sp. AD125B TaxID=3242897 RepID=UPI003527A613